MNILFHFNVMIVKTLVLMLTILSLVACRKDENQCKKPKHNTKEFSLQQFKCNIRSNGKENNLNAIKDVVTRSNYDKNVLISLVSIISSTKDLDICNNALTELRLYQTKIDLTPYLKELLGKPNLYCRVIDFVLEIMGEDKFIKSFKSWIEDKNIKHSLICNVKLKKYSKNLFDYYIEFLNDPDLATRNCVVINLKKSYENNTQSENRIKDKRFLPLIFELILSKNEFESWSAIHFLEYTSFNQSLLNQYIEESISQLSDDKLGALYGLLEDEIASPVIDLSSSIIERIGNSKSTVIKNLGQPKTYQEEDVFENTEYNKIYRIKYKGLEVYLAEGDTETSIKYTITGNNFNNFQWELGIGSARLDVIDKLGMDYSDKGMELEYSEFFEGQTYRLIFYFLDDNVYKILIEIF